MAVILALHAHPDDVETLCAGTLAVLAGAGHTVRIATATAGECGSDSTDLEETGRIRRAEAARSAQIIGAAYRCADLPDLAVFNDDPSRRRITELVRWSLADIVLAPSPVDYHPDHEAVSQLVRDACFAASVPNYRTGETAALNAIPHLYFMDPIDGRDRDGVRVKPDFGVNIEGGMSAKRAMLLAHESQNRWVARQHDIPDHLASMEGWSRAQGKSMGVPFAEGFRQYRRHPYPATPALQELLGPWLIRPTPTAP